MIAITLKLRPDVLFLVRCVEEGLYFSHPMAGLVGDRNLEHIFSTAAAVLDLDGGALFFHTNYYLNTISICKLFHQSYLCSNLVPQSIIATILGFQLLASSVLDLDWLGILRVRDPLDAAQF